MAYAQIETTAFRHAKILALSHAAFRVWAEGLGYCQEHLTDGFIPEAALRQFYPRPTPTLIAELLAAPVPNEAPCWHRVEGGYQVHNYLRRNRSRAQVLQAQQRSRDRKQRWLDDQAASAAPQPEGLELSGKAGGLPAPSLLKADDQGQERRSERRSERVPERRPERSRNATQRNAEDLPRYPTEGGALRESARGDAPTEEHRPVGRDTPRMNLRTIRNRDTSPPNPKRLAVLAREILAQAPELEGADLAEALKTRAAQLGLSYDSASVRRALDGVEHYLEAVGS